MNTSEVLNRAADLIEERGWIQGEGWGTDIEPTEQTSSLCLEGGIAAALGVTSLPELWTCPAYQAIGDYLGLEPSIPDPFLGTPGSRAVWAWNDGLERTGADEVIEVLRACAAIEASREREADEVSA